MLRTFAVTMLGLAAFGCGPDRPKCTGSVPDFIVTLKLSDRPIPDDTVVHVQYGGTGMENYVLAHPAIPEVAFCNPADENGVKIEHSSSDEAASAGAGGESGEGGATSGQQPVAEIVCQLWTGGYTQLQVSGTGLDGDMIHELSPTDACQVKQVIVLDSPDGG